MIYVRVWTGLEAHALRKAHRDSVRRFATRCAVAPRTVSKWDKLLAATTPYPDTQAILDAVLAKAPPDVRLLFDTIVSELRRAEAETDQPARRAADLDYEAWAEDLDRAIIALSWQNFTSAGELLDRWLAPLDPAELDDRGLYLYGRSLTLLGDFHCDQGALLGPQSAESTYRTARDVFTQLGIPRRVAQIELSLAVVAEMSGDAVSAGRQYDQLAVDSRLSARDRARAALWVGTALSKQDQHEEAISVMVAAARMFETLGEPDDWSSAQQKIALAHRGTGNLTGALRHIELAHSTGRAHSPLQRVQLTTATGHILLTDPATQDEGVVRLEHAEKVAAGANLGHQIRSIGKIRNLLAAPAAGTASSSKERA
ncbi:hypothetical protein KGQ20_02345 [Catenulispora sp. NF23]|uniref:Uncharacterized protein n=1 Tax=Catenulispora pinistramenti TaxID=2705254 RepID=A0ABS5KIC8_9ACTN|nr:hypothetical protein [Catenulispora pinistramenti]MBS2531606.1 hypothetical protein [Catenulispora pinistramenti]MBS2546144.1 hypothetical protein [Catenulispora pinistramenti]